MQEMPWCKWPLPFLNTSPSLDATEDIGADKNKHIYFGRVALPRLAVRGSEDYEVFWLAWGSGIIEVARSGAQYHIGAWW